MVLVGLAVASFAMANVGSWLMLVAVLFGLRLFGQGLLTHLAMTAMARWFDSHRGRALSIASLGFPAGEAVLPALAVLSIGLIGWRQTWGLAALVLLLVAAPLLFCLLRRQPTVVEERGLLDQLPVAPGEDDLMTGVAGRADDGGADALAAAGDESTGGWHGVLLCGSLAAEDHPAPDDRPEHFGFPDRLRCDRGQVPV